MSNDIGEDILKAIRAGMAQEVGGKGKIAKIITKAENGRASLNDVSELSTQLGTALSRLISVNVTPDKLPDGKLYYNIANTFLTGSLHDNFDIINVTAQAVQESIDSKNGVRIEPQKADFPAERVHSIVNAVSDETADWSTIQRRMDSPVRNVTESFYNDYVEANAEFRSDAGLKSYIIRETDGNCCTWCSSLAGQYEYPNGVSPDVYARHDNCTCTVTFISDKTKQDVWSKKSYALSAKERKEILERTPKPERFARKKAEEIEKANLKDAVGFAKSEESGIIKERGINSELGKFKQKIINDDRMSKEYYSTVKDKFSYGSDAAKSAFNKFVPDESVINSSFEGTPHFDPNTKQISMHYSADLTNERGACATWFHEHGHLIDNLAGSLSDNYEFSELLHNDYMNYMKVYGKSNGLNTFDKVQSSISEELSDMRKHSAVADILEGVSECNIQGIAGHGRAYWENPKNLTSEAFAHMFEAQFDNIRYTEMQKYFPNALSKFEEILKEAVK